jgi:diguanylate cyclase (GGDEF)-like protein
MFRLKTFTPQLNSETFLFFLLFGLSLFSSAFPITFVYGITFSFTSIFLFLMFRLFGLPLAIITAIVSFLFIPHDNMHVAYSLILLGEIFFVGIYFHIKKKAKMFFVDGLFWLTVGLAGLFFLNQSSLEGDSLYFQICKDILNGLFNVLMADMLLAYFPFYKLLKTIRLNKNNVSIHQLLSHITIISIMIPFFLIILTKSWTIQEYFSTNSKQQAENTVIQIQNDILRLHQNEVYTKGKLERIVEAYQSPNFDIILTSNENQLIASSLSGQVEDFHLQDMYKMKRIRDDFYEVLPKGQNNGLPIHKWRAGKLVYVSQMETLPIKIYIQYPISHSQDQIFKEFLTHIQISVLFLLLTIMIVFVIDRLLMKNLKQLILVTTGLPQKLMNLEYTEWPQSPISELGVLTQNLKEMAKKLKELFQESIEMNRILTIQTKKLKESEDKLHQIAYYDGLTSLPNRSHFQKYVRKLIQNHDLGTVAIIFIDLNQFKQVNDTLGHDAGDALLQLTANRLLVLHDRNREIFRLGGDEFVIVHEVEDREEIQDTLEKIHQAFSSPFKINGQVLFITGSVGISLYPDDGLDLDTLVKCADTAMYVSKEKGGNFPQFFCETMRDKYQERLVMENELRKVVHQGGFHLFYQPKLQQGEITSIEALLRWNHPTLGNVSPSIFIPLAEEINLISKIDEWTLMEACRQNKKWQDDHLMKVPISE